MKIIQKLLSTEKGAMVSLLVGANLLYSLVGLILYLTIGPIFGLIPVVTGLVLSGALAISRSIEIKNTKNQASNNLTPSQALLKINEETNRTNTNEKEITVTTPKYPSTLTNQNTQEEIKHQEVKNKVKVLVKK